MKYSLADYVLSIKTNDASLKPFGTITIGGEGTALDSISIDYANDMWETTSFATGAWIQNKNLARNGTIELTLSQLSDQVAKFIQLVNVFRSGDYKGLTVSLVDSTGTQIADCVECYFTKIPTQEFGDRAGMQTWRLTAGQITIG